MIAMILDWGTTVRTTHSILGGSTCSIHIVHHQGFVTVSAECTLVSTRAKRQSGML
jgi:hypothetical protein